MRYTLLSSAAALALIAAPAFAQTTGTLPSRLTAEEFMARAAMGDRFEIESTGIVQARSQAEAIISYARHLVEDHERTADEMRAISRDVGVSPPVEVTLGPRHRAMLDELKQAEGRDADRLFAQMQEAAHQDALTLYQSYARSGDHVALKEFARKTIPALEKHLAMARKLEGED
jgi:putative membrane protein